MDSVLVQTKLPLEDKQRMINVFQMRLNILIFKEELYEILSKRYILTSELALKLLGEVNNIKQLLANIHTISDFKLVSWTGG